MDGIPPALASDMPELPRWDAYFDERQDIQLDDRGGTFRHGSLSIRGVLPGSSWSKLEGWRSKCPLPAREVCDALCRRVYTAGSKGAVLFCLHGCGYTGLTWSLIAAAVKDRCGSLHAATPAAMCSVEIHCMPCARLPLLPHLAWRLSQGWRLAGIAWWPWTCGAMGRL